MWDNNNQFQVSMLWYVVCVDPLARKHLFPNTDAKTDQKR